MLAVTFYAEVLYILSINCPGCDQPVTARASNQPSRSKLCNHGEGRESPFEAPVTAPFTGFQEGSAPKCCCSLMLSAALVCRGPR